ncbi:MAG: 4Fe-4S dicluster domain-containing protein [Chloroflexi bacterium]|nr:4Fe-4S dicluster domain-containing protein [Chloroflexota bacterium]
MPVTTQELVQFVVSSAPVGMPEDPLLRMQEDLKRALKKDVKARRWAMVLDLRKCVGCSSCTIACIVENKLPPGVVYRPVLEEEIGTYPNVTRRFVPRPCMQCDNPPCVNVCPVNATFKRADGIIEVNYDQCIGCRYCVTACPYGARTFDFGEKYTNRAPTQEGIIVGRARVEPYETAASYEYGRVWERKGQDSPIGNVRKCHFCLHRLNAGMLPACVTTCIGRATYFGDANDPDALISSLIGSANVTRLKEELGTQPKVHYLL